MLSLHDFGSAVECDYTTASRLLSGERAPSTRLLARICRAYGLDEGKALRILAHDQETSSDGRTLLFAAFLKESVFEASDDVTTVTSETSLSDSQ